MNDLGRKYLYDITIAIEHIREFTANTDTFEQYVADLKTQSAVERQLAIIGEAIIQYRKLESMPTLSHANQIAGLRNRLIHAYDTIEPTIIWAILQNHLTVLAEEIKVIMPG
jgi:uncharacterized protein with HEPN domain